MVLSKLFLTLVILSTLTMSGSAQELQEISGLSSFPPRGEFPQEKVEPQLTDEVKAMAFADWDKIRKKDNDGNRITKVRIYGFWLREGEPVDMTIKDKDSLAIWNSFFFNFSNGFTRPAYGDLSNSDSGALTGGYGIMVFERKNGETFQIGVSQDGFYLGRWHGTARTRTYCYGLAMHLNEQLKAKAGREIPEPLLKELTGEAVLLKSKARYEAALRPAEAD